MIRQAVTLLILLFALVLAPVQGMAVACPPVAAQCQDAADCCAAMACCTGAPKPQPASTTNQHEGPLVASLALSVRSILLTLPPVPAAFPSEIVSFSAHALAPLAASGVLLL